MSTSAWVYQLVKANVLPKLVSFCTGDRYQAGIPEWYYQNKNRSYSICKYQINLNRFCAYKKLLWSCKSHIDPGLKITPPHPPICSNIVKFELWNGVAWDQFYSNIHREIWMMELALIVIVPLLIFLNIQRKESSR